MQSGLLLDIVIRERAPRREDRSWFEARVVRRRRAPVLELLASKNEALLVRGDALLVLDLLLHVVDGVAGLDVEGDGLAYGARARASPDVSERLRPRRANASRRRKRLRARRRVPAPRQRRGQRAARRRPLAAPQRPPVARAEASRRRRRAPSHPRSQLSSSQTTVAAGRGGVPVKVLTKICAGTRG